MKIEGKEILFQTEDGRITTNAIYQKTMSNGEIVFFELLGQTGIEGIPYVKIDGQNKYRRLMIQRVYPCLPVE